MSDPEISVLIPVWNGARQIHLCLDALAAQTLSRDRFEVVVVDNGSTDDTADVIRRYDFVRLLSEPEPGSYRARNTGLKELRGRYVCLTDADCIPHLDWLEKAYAAIQANPDVGIIAGQVDLFRVSASDSETCAAYESLYNLNQEAYAKGGHCATANWSSRVELLRGLGGFDASLKSSGDFEMSSRVVAAGHSLVYHADVVVRHPVRGRIKDLLTKRIRVIGGQWTLKKEQMSLGRFLYRTLFEAAWQLRVAQRSKLPLGMKMKVAGLVTLLTGAALLELVRLLFGGKPRRA